MNHLNRRMPLGPVLPWLVCVQLVSGNVQGEELQDRAALEEVLVTATYREESMQDVGLSMSALSAKSIERQGIVNFKDIALRTPGLNFSDRGPNKNNVSIRGLSNLITDTAFQRNNPLVGMFWDDVSVITSFSTQRSFNIYDIERVEVVRGPQGTLYGEGAMGGAVRYITQTPKLDHGEVQVKTTVSNTKNGDGLNWRIDGLVNIPVVENRFGLRIAAFSQENAGFIDYTGSTSDVLAGRVLDGVPEEGANDYSAQGIRVVGLFEPSEHLTARFSFSHEESETDSEFVVSSGAGDLVNTNYFTLAPQEDDITVFSGRIDYRTGYGVFSSITGYVNRERWDGAQEDGASVFFLTPSVNDFSMEEEAVSQEFRFVSDLNGPVNFLAGIYYKTVDTDNDIRIVSTLVPSPGTALDEDEFYDAEQIALFGEVGFQVTDKFEATVGLRYFKEEVDSEQIWHRPDFLLSAFPDDAFNATLTVEELLPKFLMEYMVSEDLMVYATTSRGVRNGGLNVTSTVTIGTFLGAVVPRTYQQDDAWSYELGAKSQWLDGQLTANMALYYIDWSDLQGLALNPNIGLRYLQNVGDAFSKGVEAEIAYQVNENLSVFLAANIAEAELKDSYQVAAGVTVSSGTAVPNTPEYTATMGLNFVHPVELFGSAYDLVIHADYQLVDEQPTSIESMPRDPRFFIADNFGIFNFRAAIEGERWDFSIFASNLSDERVGLNRGGNPAFGLNEFVNRPRTIGAAVQFKL